jgi:hypothetical protein
MLLATGAGIRHPVIHQQQNLTITSVCLPILKLNRVKLSGVSQKVNITLQPGTRVKNNHTMQLTQHSCCENPFQNVGVGGGRSWPTDIIYCRLYYKCPKSGGGGDAPAFAWHLSLTKRGSGMWCITCQKILLVKKISWICQTIQLIQTKTYRASIC